jgi:hemoglobin
MLRFARITIALAALLALAAPTFAQDEKKSLYDRLGGQPAVEAVVKDFAGRVLADARINKKFAKSNADRLVKNLTDFVCVTTGGPCTYTGNDMSKAHKGMGVTHGEFVALVEDLTATLDQFKVPDQEKGEVLAAFGPLEGAIVEVKSDSTGTPLPAKFKPAKPLPTKKAPKK